MDTAKPFPARGARFWLPLVAWCGLIFFLSSRPHLDLQHVTPWFPYSDLLDTPLRKLAHVAEYAVLYLLARRGWPSGRSWLFCLAYACSDEWHQTFVPGRAGRVSDVVIDAAAAALPLAWSHIKELLRRA
jgi:VanZ family protein